VAFLASGAASYITTDNNIIVGSGAGIST